MKFRCIQHIVSHFISISQNIYLCVSCVCEYAHVVCLGMRMHMYLHVLTFCELVRQYFLQIS